MIPIKHAVEFREGPGIMAEDFTDDGIPLLRVASVSAERASLDGCNFLDPEKVKLRWKQFMVRKGDMLISASATMGTVSEVDDETVGSIPYTGIIILRPRPGMITREFIKMFVVSRAYISQIERLRAGATIQHYGPFHLRQIVMSLPPYDEQEAICKRMRTVIDEIEEVAAKAADAVTLMEEHRAALIAAAVTGKIDARGYVAKAVEAAE
jgi:type I restriction enzyme, S subunit